MKEKKTRLFIFMLVILLIAVSGGCEQLTTVVSGELPVVNQPLTTRIYYRDGNLMSARYEENRVEISVSDLPSEMIQATIAAEDKHFFGHFGFDPVGIARAAYQNIIKKQVVQGGSTITQQLVKNLYLTHDRTWQRKLDEAFLTIRMEMAYSKEEILEKYLNTIYYGHTAYGIEAAAGTYFDKQASELTLGEAALLAGLPKGPLYYSPFIDYEGALRRQKIVLEQMKAEGYISSEKMEEALNEPLILKQGSDDSNNGGYVADHIINVELAHLWEDNPGLLKHGGLEIYTTIDSHMQDEAKRLFNEELEILNTDDAGTRQPQGALVAIDPNTGYLKAMVGGRDFAETNLNRVYSRRSPGSSFKPFVYAAALEQGRTASSGFVCDHIEINVPGMDEPYAPTDFGGGYHNRYLTMREAIKDSCNISAIKTNMVIGGNTTKELARRMGITSKIGEYYSMPMGTSEVTLMEMTTAFAPFANGGQRVEPVLILKVVDPEGNILIDNKPKLSKVIDESIAFLMTDMMKDVLKEGGTGHRASHILHRPAAGKTGTSHNYRDAYMVGYTPDLVTGVYIGDDHGQSLGKTGGQLATPLWASFMETVHEGLPIRDFHRPDNIIEVTLCSMTGKKKSDQCKAFGIDEIFIEGTEPQEYCSYPECPACFQPFWWWQNR